ncbi:MAG: Transcriptional regulator, MarR family [uncultured Nocardioidaceae bacterium]|uniref:Transcriptional regulator, MarR family n=1 Tax=uncultured Nocardioidaceae bacterium TaxID=253824 RepID=A0A6J4MMA7_9ACTN|nr:MAG: Transcriptional regulator, MarR family [uncultured Nocardioidaceae bacterium]
MHTTHIEQQLTILLRRVQRIHFTTSSGEIELDRSAYGILCRLVDEGPQRLGSLAQAFGLDPSTITRQVQALEHEDLVERRPDPKDRRASLLDLTVPGRQVLTETRARRREWLQAALGDWDDADHEEFGRLLEKFNLSIDKVVQECELHGAVAQPAAATDAGAVSAAGA